MLLLYIFELLPVYFHSSVFFLVFMFNWSTVYIRVSSHQHTNTREGNTNMGPPRPARDARGGLVLYFTFELPDRRRTTLFRLLIFFSPLNLITGRCVV